MTRQDQLKAAELKGYNHFNTVTDSLCTEDNPYKAGAFKAAWQAGWERAWAERMDHLEICESLLTPSVNADVEKVYPPVSTMNLLPKNLQKHACKIYDALKAEFGGNTIIGECFTDANLMEEVAETIRQNEYLFCNSRMWTYSVPMAIKYWRGRDREDQQKFDEAVGF